MKKREEQRLVLDSTAVAGGEDLAHTKSKKYQPCVADSGVDDALLATMTSVK